MPTGYADLPAEIRLQILEYTDLVTPLTDGLYIDTARGMGPMTRGIYVHGGRALFGDTFPKALFRVSRDVMDDAIKVCFSNNRLILSGDLRETLEYLHLLPVHALKYLKALDLRVDMEQLKGFYNDFSYEEVQYFWHDSEERQAHLERLRQSIWYLQNYLPDTLPAVLNEFCCCLSPNQLRLLFMDLSDYWSNWAKLNKRRTKERKKSPRPWNMTFEEVQTTYRSKPEVGEWEASDGVSSAEAPQKRVDDKVKIREVASWFFPIAS